MADRLRLLFCRDCRSIEELPMFDGRPDDDVLLARLVEAHWFPNGEEHVGLLADIAKDDWANPDKRKAAINKTLAQANFPGGAEGMGDEWYATKNTFQEDALTCFNRHRRPEVCIDWHSDKKRIQNPTETGWQGGPKVYLCDFCPVASLVMTEQRHRAGYYKEK